MSTIDPTQVRALLFDLGGVLIDIDPERAFAHWARSADADAGMLRQRFQVGDAYRRHERGEITEAAWFGALREQLGIELDDARMAAGWNALLGDVLPGVAEQIERAAALRPIYLFSNTDRTHRAVWAERHAGLLAPFSGVFVSCELGMRKPEPQAYIEVAQAIGCRPSQILFFDDVPENVDGARSAGLQAVRVRGVEPIARALESLAEAAG